MTENPFAAHQSPEGSKLKPKTSPRNVEFFHNALRGLIAFLCLGFVPVFIMPIFINMFEEFGIELPGLSILIVNFSSRARMFWIVFLPFSLCAFAGIEFGLFAMPKGTLKTLANVAYWIALICVIGIVCLSLAIPCIAIINGLMATVLSFSFGV